MSESKNSRQHKKRSWLIALIVSIFCPGLGQIYNTELKKGVIIYICYFISYCAMLMTAAVVYISLHVLVVVAFLNIILLITHIYAIVDAVKGTRRVQTIVLTGQNGFLHRFLPKSRHACAGG